MRSRKDREIDRQVKGAKPSANGGKALRRLFNYNAGRNTALNNELLSRLVIPNASISRFVLSKNMTETKAAKTLAAAPRKRRRPPTAKSYASAISKAATLLVRKPRRRRKARKLAAAPAPGAPVWQALGPNVIPNGQTYGTNRIDVIGRVSCIAIDPKDTKHILLGAAGGGIWESKDTGSSWAPCTDLMPSLAIGAIAFDPSNARLVYAGSGEGNFYSSLGAGVYRSTDGGTTWVVLASSRFMGIGFYDLVVDPKDPKILYGATTGGFFKSTNSGSTWSLTRPGTCWSISVHPNGGSVELLAAFPDGLFASTNAGNTFTAVALPAKPAAAWTRLSVDRVKTTPDVAYVFGASGNAPYLWRRSGAVWTMIAFPQVVLTALNTKQAWYDWYVAATPDSSSQVYIGAIDTFRGDLTGAAWKWTNITTQGGNSVHPDQHCLTFEPGNSKIIYAGNDGGLFRSTNQGGSWKALNKGLGITEIEYMASDPASSWLMAGLQDNGTIGFTGASWDHLADGDGGHCKIDQQNPNIVYHSFYNVTLERSSNKGTTWTSLAPPNIASLFYPPLDIASLTIGIGAISLVVTRTGGPPWTTVPLGLTNNEISTALRALDANTLLIGTNFGTVLKVSWNGNAWTKVKLTSPAAKYISCIAIDPSNPQRIWLTSSQITGAGGRVYRSDNSGTSWKNCTTGLPNIPINSVTVDPANYQRVWVAADVGVYQSLDNGATWAPFSNGLPNAMAVDLLLHKQDRRLICGTRSRGAWVIQVP